MGAMDMKRFSFSSLLAYGLFGLPLALVALPIYVYVPQFYAERFGLSLALIGAALLAARLFDAFIDPVIGLWIDRSRNSIGYSRFALLALAPLVIGFIALFHPLAIANRFPFTWFLTSLMLVYAGFSLAMIVHQSWGAALTQQQSERSRVTATREACGLIGVILAAALPGLAGIGWLSMLFVATLLAACALLIFAAPRPAVPVSSASEVVALAGPFLNSHFRWLFAVFVINGIAAAIPATLFLFFVKDQLQLAQYGGHFLVLYFVAAAVSLPLWVVLARRFGEARTWLAAMALAVASFGWIFGLAPGAALTFGAICVISGFALGADLALPPALLAAVISHAGDSARHEGAYFGLWNWASKMNLALAAGISLPLLGLLGYTPGTVGSQGAGALVIAYAVLPCIFKLAAAAVLWRAPLRNL
jgi:GPH family glycoside/pentoside/hexuronide:cation symporter